MNLGEMIDKLYLLREDKAELNRQIKEIDTEFETIQQQVLQQLNEQGVETGKSKLASATISRSVVPNVVDWDQFYEYIVDSKQPFLLERRPSVTIYRDLLQAGEEVPGVEPFNKVTLSLRKNR